MRVHGRYVAVGDVVLYKYLADGCSDVRVGKVKSHANCDCDLVTCVSHWPVTHDTSQYKEAVVNDEYTVVPSAWLLQAVIFSRSSEVNQPC